MKYSNLIFSDFAQPNENSERTNNDVKQIKPYNVLLLSTVGRSGSSFVGRLLHSQPDSFYFYEPLMKIEEWNRLTKETAIRSLKAMFTCNIQGLILKAIQNSAAPIIKHNNLAPCENNTAECLTSEQLNIKCRNNSVKIIKTIRTKVSWLLPLLDDPAINLKVIHLVRDPRGSLISNWKAGWNNTAERSCLNMRDDLNSGRNLFRLYPDKYMAF